MEKFNKLSRAEMKKVAGGGERVCYTDNFCWMTNPFTQVYDPGAWCSIPESGVGCQCFNPDWQFEPGGGMGDVSFCFTPPGV